MRSQRTGVIQLATTHDDDRIVVQITDSLAGIPVLCKRLSEPFFTTKPVGKGSGLGLEVVRRIVENRPDGTISVQSLPLRNSVYGLLTRHCGQMTFVNTL